MKYNLSYDIMNKIERCVINMVNQMKILDVLKKSKIYFEDFISRSTYHSNAIEGSTLSFAETYALLFDNKHSKIEQAEAKEIYEAINHKYALNKIIDRVESGKFCMDESFLTEINQIINHNIMYVGGYRMGLIRIRGSEKKFPLPKDLGDIMNEFYERYNVLFQSKFSMKDIANMHLDYENIHPYPDGNGRTGRLMINYILLSDNQVPVVIPFESRKYYLSLMENNDIDGLAEMFDQLQSKEKERIHDFIDMEQEQSRQSSKYNEDLSR